MKPFAGGPQGNYRQDGGAYVNSRTKVGTTSDKSRGSRYLADAPVTRAEIDAMIRNNPYARKVAFRASKDAIRRGAMPVGLDPDQTKKVNKRADSLKVLSTLARAWGLSKAYGGAGVVIMVDDGLDPNEPLDIENFNRITALVPVNKYGLNRRSSIIDEDPGSRTFRQRAYYGVTFPQSGRTVVYHASRILKFDGVDIGDELMERNNGWGGSVFDLINDRLANLDSSIAYMMNALDGVGMKVIKSTGLSNSIAGGKKEDIENRLRAFNASLGLLGMGIIDAQDDMQVAGVPLAGTGDVFDRIVTAIVAAIDMPRSIFLGETPGGLNTGENAGETRSWYDSVEQDRALEFEDHANFVYDLILREKGEDGSVGAVPESYEGLEYPPLWQPNEVEKSTTRKTNAESRALDLTNGVVTIEEVRSDPSLVSEYDLGTDVPVSEEELMMGGDEVLDEEGDERDLPPPPPSDLRTASMAASEIGEVSAGQIKGMIKRGEINSWRIGGRFMVSKGEVQSAIFEPVTNDTEEPEEE